MYGCFVVRMPYTFLILSCRDYRGLKKRIAAVRRGREGAAVIEQSSGDDPLLSPVNEDNESAASPVEGRDADDANVEDEDEDEDETSDVQKPRKSPQRSAESPFIQAAVSPKPHSATLDAISTASHPLPTTSEAQSGYLGRSQSFREFASKLRLPSFSSPVAGPQPRLAHSSTVSDVRLDLETNPTGQLRPQSNGKATSDRKPPTIRHLKDLLPTLTPTQRKFFDKLDLELEKIETFYLDREKDARQRSEALRVQLHELRDHRRVFYVSYAMCVLTAPFNVVCRMPIRLPQYGRTHSPSSPAEARPMSSTFKPTWTPMRTMSDMHT